MKKEITWIGATGSKISVVVELVTEEIIDLDGDKVTVKCCHKTISANVEGIGNVGCNLKKLNKPVISNGLEIVATIGKLGLTVNQYNAINAMISEIETAPEWQAKIKNEIENNKVTDEIEAHRCRINKAMEE